ALARFAVWSLDEQMHPGNLGVIEPGGIHRRFRALQISPTNQDINIASVPDRSLVDARDPVCDCVPANYGISNTSGFQCLRGTVTAFAYFFHGSDHPFPRGFVK